MRSTRKTARRVTMARERMSATMHSVKVNFGFARSSWWSRSACSSASRTLSKMEWFERAL
jgi:hypothetical protein